MPQGNSLHPDWERAGRRRRLLLLFLIVIPALAAARLMYGMIPFKTEPVLAFISVSLFTVLFAWISVGFWTSLAGLLAILFRFDRFSPTSRLPQSLEIKGKPRTALLFPVYNEDVAAVAMGIRTVLSSLRQTGQQGLFDLYILSDSTDPDIWVQEEEAWYNLCQTEQAFDRIHYRRRKSNIKRKSGNIADFCRRWGANYQYMIVFDADSVMTGETLVRMVQCMEENPKVGILQTAPKVVNSRSLIARVQQFANHLYGPVFAAGMHFWQLGDAQFWGHNAIIRVAPFIRHCQLPVLSGTGPLGGAILSHDFVESALIRRGGYEVWLAYGLGGSYEETPPSLLDELARDRRWCQGNLQHARLIFTQGFFPVHRALFINGIMAYCSALLWLLFLIVSSVQVVSELFVEPDYFPAGASLFPNWPEYFPEWSLHLLGGTAALLFLPKILALLLVMGRGGARNFGGLPLMALSVVGEVLVSTFLAPVRMLFHSGFVLGALAGYSTGWKAQNRDSGGTSWSEALRVHWWGTLLGFAWSGLMYLMNPGFFLWMSPVMAGLILSVPLSVWTSRIRLGEGAHRFGLFLTPEDISPTPELTYRKELESASGQEARQPLNIPYRAGFIRAVVIPSVLVLHTSLNNRQRAASHAKSRRLESLREKVLENGPEAIDASEKIALLMDPDSMQELHRAVWGLEDNAKATRWHINR